MSDNDAGNGPGGGIYTSGTTNLNEVIVGNNMATGAGGGLYVVDGSLDATDVAITGNGGAVGVGGGIYQEDIGDGPATIDLNRATISGNTASGGAGGALLENGTHTFTNVTVSGNDATGGGSEGGGIIVVGTGALGLNYSTVVDNSAPVGGGVQNMDSSTVTYTASLVSDNAGGDCHTYDSGMRVSNDFNVAGDNTCGFSEANDLNNAGPMLGSTLDPLADNGGWFGVLTTHALLSGNPALDRATTLGSCPATDERGETRPNGPACDSGAYEAVYTPSPDSDYELAISKTLVGEAKAGGQANWRIVISNVGTDPAPGRLTFADTLPDGVSFTSVDAPDWDCSVEGRTVTCFYDDDLDPGVVTELTIVAAVHGAEGSDITNTASVSTFGSVTPTFGTGPGEVAAPPDPGPNADDPSGGDPSGAPTGGSSGAGDPTGTLPFTGFHLAGIALAAAAAVALGATLAWRNRRRSPA